MTKIVDLPRDRTGYDPTSQTYHAQHDWAGEESLTETIVNAFSAVAGIEPAAPLYDSVDPVDLENVIRSMRFGERRVLGSVQFEHAGRVITIDTEGEIQIECRSSDNLQA